MILRNTENFCTERHGRFLRVELKRRHSVLSSCPVNGGWREDLQFLVNHQSCEGREDNRHCEIVNEIGEAGYHEKTCAELGLPPGHTALLSTAANMQYAAWSEQNDGDLNATAFITAGVKGNAARAGDSANWHENDEGKVVAISEAREVPAGTIHILLLYNRPLSPGALSRSLATVVEAKAAVLQELAVPSLYGPGLATGTGTDGFALAAVESPGTIPRHFAGAHSKLGEITGRVVATALREALRWQNGLDPSATRNLFHALSRFGIRETTLSDALKASAPDDSREVLLQNREALWHEPQVAAAAYGLAAILDRAAYGTLPPLARDEAVLNQLALLACAVAHDPGSFSPFRAALAEAWKGMERENWLTPVLAHAIALGWNAKWASR